MQQRSIPVERNYMRYTIAMLLLAVATGHAASLERSLPSFFIPNPYPSKSVRYIVDTPELRAAFAPDCAIFQIQGLSLRVSFGGANRDVTIEGQQPLRGHANFLLGDRPEDWKTGLPVYQKIVYRNIYPGIDMSYGGSGHRIKSEFVIASGADPNVIRLEYSGAGDLSIAANGDLLVRAGAIEVREQAPVVYQESAHERVTVAARYKLADSHTVEFELGSFDGSRPLVIDPVLSYATYLGGSGMSAVTGLAVDSAGSLYVTGWTESLDFQIFGALQAADAGGVDAFVAKLNPSGTGLLYATYIGGRGDDRAAGIAVDGSGQAYVAGSTASSNFPLVAPIRSVLGGGRDAFALKLNSSGSALVYSTLLGGSNIDAAKAVAVDSAGNAYIAGDTLSADFAVTAALQPMLGGKTDAFVAKLNPAGAVIFSTFLGGASDEHAAGIAVDIGGNIYVAGGTASTNFPVVTPIQAVNRGSQDAFLSKLSSNGQQLIYSTYLGGSGGGAGSPEQANAVAVDAAGNAYIAGVTNSPDFPVTAGAFQTSFNGVQDAFVAKINAAGNALAYSTYLGGSSFDWASSLAIDAGGNAYAAGYTSSLGMATVTPVQPGFNGLYDAFVSRLNPQGNALGFSTFYGGTGADEANAIAVDASGNMFVGGQSSSLDLALATPIQSSNIGGSIGWVARLGVTPVPPQIPSAISVTPSSGNGNTVLFTAQFSDPAGATSLTTAALLLNTTAAPNYGCQVTYTPSANQFSLANDVASTGSATVLPGGGSAQNSQCTLDGANSSAVFSGSTLTLRISLAFQPGFPGNKTVYLYAADSGTNTGWAARGMWTVTIPPPQPSADSVSPNGSTGSSQTFTFVFSDTQSALNLTGMAMLFNSSLSTAHGCSMTYDRVAGTLGLTWDGANGADTKPINSASTVQNSQCIVGASSVTLSGLSNILTLAITFKGAFTGVKNIYMYGSESGLYTTGWVQKGTYTVAAGGIPVANSVVPGTGSGPGQRFSFTVSDQGGSGFINGVAVLISSSLSTANACYLVYDRTVNRISLSYDNPANGASPVVPGSGAIVSNGQCALRGANTTVVIGSTSVVVTLDLTFSATFFGAKNIYLYGSEPGVNSGWVNIGSWTVTGGAPTADSVTPSSGAGSAPSFTVTVSDSSAATNISGISMLVTSGAPSNTTGACYLLYDRVGGTIGLYSDNGGSLATKGIGSSAALQNSQCAVGYTAGNMSGNSVMLTINLVFKAPFNGVKTVYLQANEPNASSGWVSRGAWTVQ